MGFLTKYYTHYHGYPLASLRNIMKVIHIFMLLTIPISFITLMTLSLTGIIPQLPVPSEDHLLVAIAFWVGAILLLFIGIGSWLYTKAHSNKKREVLDIWVGHVFQMMAFWGPAMCGIFAAISGVTWYVYVPMILVALPGLILTFPTEKRWANLFHEVES